MAQDALYQPKIGYFSMAIALESAMLTRPGRKHQARRQHDRSFFRDGRLDIT
jgi:hypothetical protein